MPLALRPLPLLHISPLQSTSAVSLYIEAPRLEYTYMGSSDEDDSRSPSDSISLPPYAFAAVPTLSVYRKSARICPNQALVDELAVLRAWMFLKHGSELLANLIFVGRPQTTHQNRRVPQHRKIDESGEPFRRSQMSTPKLTFAFAEQTRNSAKF